MVPSTFRELILAWHLSVVCFAHSPLNINKKSFRTCVCGDIETEIHLFFYCNKSPEFFDCLSNVELLHVFLFGLPDDEPSHISVAVFCAVNDFLKYCNRFWQHPRVLVHRIWEIRAFLLYKFCWCRSVATAMKSIWCAWCVDLRFRCCIQYCWCVPEVLY